METIEGCLNHSPKELFNPICKVATYCKEIPQVFKLIVQKLHSFGHLSSLSFGGTFSSAQNKVKIEMKDFSELFYPHRAGPNDPNKLQNLSVKLAVTQSHRWKTEIPKSPMDETKQQIYSLSNIKLGIFSIFLFCPCRIIT